MQLISSAGFFLHKATHAPQMDTLADFTRELISTNGTMLASTVAKIKAAGFTNTQIVEIVLAITSITFTNLFNRI